MQKRKGSDKGQVKPNRDSGLDDSFLAFSKLDKRIQAEVKIKFLRKELKLA